MRRRRPPPNWFESSPARAVIVHTLVVAAAVWAAFNFVFDENKVAVHKAQAEQYKAKTEVLEAEIARLREENKRYLEWLGDSPRSSPYLEAKVKEQADQIAALRLQAPIPASGSASATGSLSVVPSPYSVQATIAYGEAFVDPKTRATIGLARISPDRSVSVNVTLPGQPSQEETEVKTGRVWSFMFEGSKYSLTLVRVNWYANSAGVEVAQVPVQK